MDVSKYKTPSDNPNFKCKLNMNYVDHNTIWSAMISLRDKLMEDIIDILNNKYSVVITDLYHLDSYSLGDAYKSHLSNDQKIKDLDDELVEAVNLKRRIMQIP